MNRSGGKVVLQVVSSAVQPTARPISDRQAFYLLANIDEFPEALPVAHSIATEFLEPQGFIDEVVGASTADPAQTLQGLIDRLEQKRVRIVSHPSDLACLDTRDRALRYFHQYAPTALIHGCWLQWSARVATAHTSIGAQMTRLYEQEVCAFDSSPADHFVSEFRDLHKHLLGALPDVAARSFSDATTLLNSSFDLALRLMSIGQFPQTFLPEILGCHLAWQRLGMSNFGTDLNQKVRELCSVTSSGSTGSDAENRITDSRLTLDVINEFVDSQTEGAEQALRRIAAGAGMIVVGCEQWFGDMELYVGHANQTPRQRMLELLRRKAPHAYGYHGDKRIAGQLIDEQFAPDQFDAAEFVDKLAASRFVVHGHPEKSHLVNGLVRHGGPMLAVFSDDELETIREWISTLPNQAAADGGLNGAVDAGDSIETRSRPLWSKSEFLQRSKDRFGRCSVRDLYHYLVNVEFFPDILPVAERFARQRFERSMAQLKGTERPIPSQNYSADALESWVYAKHREQVDSYRPLTREPVVSKTEFIESTLQLAPLILIDGGWLQGVTSPTLIHTEIGRRLFRIFYEELGEGDAALHHANVYRRLLSAMGEHAPPVDSVEFSRWPRLRDASFDVPALWMSISCFPRHFLPEILGLNLAVELAGIGGPYMQARDTLRFFGFPTEFVELHNAADNVSNGHAGQSMEVIKTYMEEVAAREGPHGLNEKWHRVWSGVRATLPQIGYLRLLTHRVYTRLFGTPESQVPLIFNA